MFASGLKVGKDRPFLGHRPITSTSPLQFAKQFVWQTYGEVDLRRRYVGSALSSMFRSGELGGGEYETVGIWSPNRPGEVQSILHLLFWLMHDAEWQVIDIALQSYDKVSVSLYDTLGQDSVGQSNLLRILLLC